MFPLIRTNREPQKSHDYGHLNVFKKVCFQNVLYPASNLSRGRGARKGAKILSSFHASTPPARRQLARSVLRPCWSAKSTFSNDLFIFRTVRLNKLHKYAGIHHWSLQKGVYLAWTLYLAWSGGPPPPSSPAVFNLLLTREEGTICSWNHRCERDWCLQIAIRKDWFQIERIPGQKETGLCTYGTQAPTGYHCPLLWL